MSTIEIPLSEHERASLKSIYDEIATMEQMEIPRLPEALFVQHLLPMMTTTDRAIDVGLWNDLAGHPLRPIDVVDPRGNVLFRVPALLKTLPTQQHFSGLSSVAEALKEYQSTSNIHPMLGDETFKARMQSKLPTPDADLTDLMTWNAILAHYNKPTLPLPGQPDSPSTLPSPVPAQGVADSGESTGRLVVTDEQENF